MVWLILDTQLPQFHLQRLRSLTLVGERLHPALSGTLDVAAPISQRPPGSLWFAMFAEGPIKGSEVVTLRKLIQPRVDSSGQFRRSTVQAHEHKTKVIHTHATQLPYGCQDFGLGWTTIAWHARPGAQPLLLSPPLHLNQTCCN